jgi:hypothetical protein
MIIEYAQILSTAHHVLDGKKAIDGLYKCTHVNHPCTKWARENKINYVSLYELFIELCKEYTYRYSKEHATYTKLHEVLRTVPKNIPDICDEIVYFPVAISNKEIIMYDSDDEIDIVETYRNYYKTEKKNFATWRNREIPYWMLKN